MYMCEDCVHKDIPGGCPVAVLFNRGEPGEFRSTGPGVQCVMFHEEMPEDKPVPYFAGDQLKLEEDSDR